MPVREMSTHTHTPNFKEFIRKSEALLFPFFDVCSSVFLRVLSYFGACFFIPVCEDLFVRAMESLFRIKGFGPKEKSL